MTILNVIYSHQLSFQPNELRRFLTQAGLSIQNLQTYTDLHEAFQSLGEANTYLILCESETGITQSEDTRISSSLTHRFRSAEHSLCAQDPFKQVLVGAKGESIVLILPADQVMLRSLNALLNHLPRPAMIDDFEPEAERQTFVDHITVIETPNADLPREPSEPIGSGWQSGLKAIGGKIESEIWATIPESISQIAPARNVLEGAGERKAVRLHSGKIYVLFGYPDLRRPTSKAILIGDADPFVEIIALHRSPNRVGIVCSTGTEWLPSIDRSFDKITLQRTNKEAPQSGTLFALEQQTVYYQISGHVFSWDGKKEKSMGTVKQAIASLLLSWSQR
ncbi:MAG: hypothetical protein VX278_18795 [Myxococcota bacterium]|nr:hypothetical protein [Myxococcota bacterium]